MPGPAGREGEGEAGKTRRGPQMPDPLMLDLLVCPLTHTSLRLDRERMELVSMAARLAFPIRDSIPIMLASEARPLSDEEIAAG
jgi:uncharacterized protein YbaR (Trm112 family)